MIEEFQNATLSISKVVNSIPERMEKLSKLQSRYDSELSDLEHLAEFENFNAAEGYKIAKQIQNARRKRRDIKDEIEILLEIKAVANNNSKLDGHLSVLDKRMTEIGKHRSTRNYKVRVRTDLQQRFTKCIKNNKQGE